MAVIWIERARNVNAPFFANEQPIVSTLALFLRFNTPAHAKFEHGFTSSFSRGFDGRSPSRGLSCLLDMQILSNIRYDKHQELFTKSCPRLTRSRDGHQDDLEAFCQSRLSPPLDRFDCFLIYKMCAVGFITLHHYTEECFSPPV